MAGCGLSFLNAEKRHLHIFQFVDEQDDVIRVEDHTHICGIDCENAIVGELLADYGLNNPEDDKERREVLEGIFQIHGIEAVLVDQCMQQMGLLRVKMACNPDARGVPDA